MKPKTFRHCLSLLLACVLLVQAAFVVADWHVDLPVQHVQAVEMAYCEHHMVEAVAAMSDTTSLHHHHCCHAGNGSLFSTPSHGFVVPLSALTSPLPTFALEPYRDPHTDQLIRPPIA